MNVKNLLTGVLLLTISASCSDNFLDIPPQDVVTSATFFKTEADFLQAINGNYAALRGLYSDAYAMGEMRSDNTHYILNTSNRGGQIVQREQIADFVDDPLNMFTANKYYSDYNIVSRANAVISKIDAATFSADSKNNIKGQALFLRAFAYYDLVQYYGDVPLYLKLVEDQSETVLPRSSKDDVYAQIIADAKDAINLLPQTQSDKGRVTKGAALTLLGYVYMTQKNYKDAETQLTQVTTLGYNLLPGYAAVFDIANKNSVESIFEVQYQEGTQGLQSNFTYIFIPGLTNTQPITGLVGNNQDAGGWNTPTDDLIASYETNDTRKAASIADGYTGSDGKFVAQPYIKKYLHPHANFNNTNDDWPVYRYADVLLLLAECLNEQGKSTQALPLLNRVRTRAGLPSTTTTDQARLRDIIAHERRIELAFENKRWLDLVRTGKAIEVMTAFGVKQKQKYAYLLPQSYAVTPNRLIFPIPQQEIIINPQLTQNPGY
jgi:tetratricopeptide (TPR) repeat protein